MRARGESPGGRETVAALVRWYREDAVSGWGRTKAADLAALERSGLAGKVAARLTALDVIEHVRARRSAGAGPATAANDVIWLRAVLRAARLPKGLPASVLQAVDDAAAELRRQRVTGKSRSRSRRLAAGEEAALLAYFDGRRGVIPMGAIIRFALLTARRQEEITRIRFADVDRKRGIVWLDDVKHPTHKVGNRRAFRILPPALAILDAQPAGDHPFPYDPKSVGEAFRRGCKMLGIVGLRFHDLRHEATSRLFEAGYSIQEVAQFTLHESWHTLKRYTHLRPEDVPNRLHRPDRDDTAGADPGDCDYGACDVDAPR
jgi:integrase